jgi:hypothetical protein
VSVGYGAMGKWRVDVFRNRLLQLGTISAPNAQEALTQAYNVFRIDPKAREKVTITKLETPNPKRRLRTPPSHSIG